LIRLLILVVLGVIAYQLVVSNRLKQADGPRRVPGKRRKDDYTDYEEL
jgi:hypothetical protein